MNLEQKPHICKWRVDVNSDPYQIKARMQEKGIKIKAVIFDLGGVVCHSPFSAIADYERENDIPKGYINVCIKTHGKDSAFAQFEKNEIDTKTYFVKFKQQIEDPEQEKRFRDYTGYQGAIHPFKVDVRELMVSMGEVSRIVRKSYIHAINQLKKNGLKVAALTNNFRMDGVELEPDVPLKELFDEFVESVKVGARKPEPKMYELVLSKLGVSPQESIFLDDIGQNLKGAKNLGMHTIKVNLGHEDIALVELGSILGLNLSQRSHM